MSTEDQILATNYGDNFDQFLINMVGGGHALSKSQGPGSRNKNMGGMNMSHTGLGNIINPTRKDFKYKKNAFRA